jgi:hypothetical protein
MQVVNKNGEYAAEDVESFVRSTGLDRANVDYTIVAIMGPQSSGRRTSARSWHSHSCPIHITL